MGGPRLLAILAHPDDESFGLGGTLAKYAREGVEVHVCTVTDGAAGSVNLSEEPEEELPPLTRVRRQELVCAARVLEVQLHTLDYRDSGMEGTEDNRHPRSLYQADLDGVSQKLLRLIAEVRPHVIVTHDPTGGYFHPDHVKVNHAVRRAWSQLTARPDSVAPSNGFAPWIPARLYYTVFPRSAFKWLLRVLRLLRRDPRRFGQNRDVDLTQVGTPDEQIHVRLDVRPYLSIKAQASACHKSQGGGGFRLVPAFLRRRLFRYEYFVQARPPGDGLQADLFSGLELS